MKSLEARIARLEKILANREDSLENLSILADHVVDEVGKLFDIEIYVPPRIIDGKALVSFVVTPDVDFAGLDLFITVTESYTNFVDISVHTARNEFKRDFKRFYARPSNVAACIRLTISEFEVWCAEEL